jgi:hypothetical protein
MHKSSFENTYVFYSVHVAKESIYKTAFEAHTAAANTALNIK